MAEPLHRRSFLSLQKPAALEIICTPAQAYAIQHTSPEDELLREIAAYASKLPNAGMLSGHVQGKFLEMISFLLRPKRILEIGTFLGYSALCLAKGLQEDGILHTIESRKDTAETARNYFRRSGLQNLQMHEGAAIDILPGLMETWDLVFIDADKINYSNYYRLVLPRVRSGGFILADNVLFHGEVLEDPISGKYAAAIHHFNELVAADTSVEKVLLTIRDGLLLIRKN